MSTRVLVRSILVFVMFCTIAVHAQSRGQGRRSGPGTGNPDDHIVPWKYLQAEELAHDHPITLYWVPTSLEQSENSPLMESQYLLDASTRCVDLEVLLPERAALLKKLNVTAPAAFIVDRQGQITRKLDKPTPKSVETLLTAELAVHDDAMYHDLVEAGRQEKAGNNAAAIELYKKIWDDRCLFSIAGAEAQRGLKRLGVIVKETPAPPPPDPSLKPSRTTTH
jgi:hypothetical protein